MAGAPHPQEGRCLMEFVYFVLMAIAVSAFVSYPFWGDWRGSEAEDPAIAALEAAREAKYREIRDAEVDLKTGKLTREDYDRINAELRSDAVEILRKLDRARGVEKPETG
jgi:hypothetical protein